MRNQKSNSGKKAISYGVPKDNLHPAALAVGPCPRCGRIDLWLNDVPLKVFCWGAPDKPHREWSKRVPKPFNPYLADFDRDARPKVDFEIEERQQKA